MWNLKTNDTNELFMKQKHSQNQRKNLWGSRGVKGGSGWRVDWEFQLDMYTVLFLNT